MFPEARPVGRPTQQGVARLRRRSLQSDRRAPRSGRPPARRRRSSSMRSPRGAVAPISARSRRTRSGSIASITDVSVRPAWASPPGWVGCQMRTGRPSASHTTAAACTASAFPPWPLTNTTRSNSGPVVRTISTIAAVSTSRPIDNVPAKPACPRMHRPGAQAQRSRQAPPPPLVRQR